MAAASIVLWEEERVEWHNRQTGTLRVREEAPHARARQRPRSAAATSPAANPPRALRGTSPWRHTRPPFVPHEFEREDGHASLSTSSRRSAAFTGRYRCEPGSGAVKAGSACRSLGKGAVAAAQPVWRAASAAEEACACADAAGWKAPDSRAPASPEPYATGSPATVPVLPPRPQQSGEEIQCRSSRAAMKEQEQKRQQSSAREQR